MDAIDCQILRLLQSDAARSARIVADQVGLSTAATQRRINRLSADGVITRMRAMVDPAAVGLSTTCIVTVALERDGSEVIQRLKAKFQDHPSITHLYYVTGEPDFVLVVVTPTIADFEAFTREMLLADTDVRSFTTLVVLETMKAGEPLPIPVRET